MSVTSIGRAQHTEFSATTAPPAQTPAPAALPDPLAQLAMGDDMIAQVTAMLAKSFRADRKDAKKLQRAQEKLEAAETAKRVSELHAKADAIGKEALVTGLTQMAGAALQVAGSAAALSSAANAASASQKGAQDVYLAKASGYSGLGAGCGQGVTAAGIPIASTYKTEQTERDASAIAHEGAAERAKGRAREFADEADDNRQLLRKVADFLKAVREGQNASQAAALRKA